MYNTNGKFGQNITPALCYGAIHLHNVIVLKESNCEQLHGYHIHMTPNRRVIYERFEVSSDVYTECVFIGHTTVDCDTIERLCMTNMENQLDEALKFIGCYKWVSKTTDVFLNYGDTRENNKKNALYNVKISSHSCTSANTQFMMGQCDCSVQQ